MKRLAVAAGLVLLCSFPGFAEGLKPFDLEKGLHSALLNSGFKCVVVVKDYDKDGVLDIVITYIAGNEKKPVTVLLGAVIGGVASLTQDLSWKCDKVIVVLNEHKNWRSTAADCRKCWENHGGAGTDEELGRCVLDTWTEENH